MTRSSAKKATKVMRGFSWLHENELTAGQRNRIIKMHNDGYTSAEIGKALKIASDDARDPFRPVRHILNALRFQNKIEGHAPRGKRPIVKRNGDRRKDGRRGNGKATK